MIRSVLALVVMCQLMCCGSLMTPPPTPTVADATAETGRREVPAPVRRADGAFRAIWVTRWDYRTEADVRRVIIDAASLGMTDVMWQVRGQADALYKSELEPWSEELFRDLPAGAKDPGFDPLTVAVAEAHSHGLRLHAWVNVMPLWKGKTPPRSPKHPYKTHPEWRLRDGAGNEQALNDHYVIVNPLMPEVQDHIVAVCRDIVTRYDVDGVHMDYIRFVSDTMKQPAAFPGDAGSIKLFAASLGREVKTGKNGALVEAADIAAFQTFKRDSITRLVRRIRTEAVLARPGVQFTAAVWRTPELARETYLQDAAAWLRDGVLDRAMPMIYTADDAQFESDAKAWIAAAPGRPITPGVASYMQKPDQTPRQITRSKELGAQGVAVFAYASLFESVDPNQDKRPADVTLRAQRRVALDAYLATPGSPK